MINAGERRRSHSNRTAMTICLLLPVLAGCGSSAGSSGPSTPVVSQKIGTVRFILRGLAVQPPHFRFRRGKVRDPLFTRYGIRTKTSQRASVAFHDGSLMYVNQQTYAVLFSPHVTLMKSGEINLSDQLGTAHRIQTANAIATAIGTNFDVRARGKVTTVAVVSGKVRVTNRAGTVTVAENQETTVTGTRAPTTPRTVDAATAIGWTGELSAGGWQKLKATDVLRGPRGIDVDQSGSIFVVSSSDSKVYKISRAGQVVSSFGSTGKKPGQFQEAGDIAVDSAGRLYVIDSLAGMLDEFSAGGTFIASVGRSGDPGSASGESWSPSGVAVGPSGDIYVVGSGNSRVERFSPSLKLKQVVALSSVPSGLSRASGVAVDSRGNIYIVDQGNDRVIKLSPTGKFITAWGTMGTGPGQFNTPMGIAVDAHANVYVAELFNYRVDEFSSSGEFLTMWGGGPSHPFFEPNGVAVGPDGTVYEIEDNTVWALPGGQG